MKKAGGIIAIIAGVFGIFAAGATLLVGGIGAAAQTEGANTVVGLGWGGVLFSFLVIIFGAVALGATTKRPGVLLILSSIGGAILGGTLVAVFMVLSLVGGILATLGVRALSQTPAQASSVKGLIPPSSGVVLSPLPGSAAVSTASGPPVLSTPEAPRKMSLITKVALWVFGAFVGLIVLGALVAPEKKGSSVSSSSSAAHPPMLAARVGGAFSTPTFEIEVRSAKSRLSVGNPPFATQPSDGAIYIAIQWSYRNISRKPVSAFRKPTVRLVAPDGTKYHPDLGASASYATEVDIDAKALSDLNPGIRVVDAQVFEVSRELFDPSSWRILIDADRDTEVQFQEPDRAPR